MKRFLRYLSLFLTMSQMTPLFCQVSEHQVVWLNRNQEKMAGVLQMSLTNDPKASAFRIDIQIEWLDSNGQSIESDLQKPLLYLAESDIETNSISDIFCKTFTDTDQFDLYFRDQGSLEFGYLPDLNQTVELRFQFKYAFSEADIFSARTYLLEFQSGSRLVYRIPWSLLKPEPETELVDTNDQTDPALIHLCQEIDSCLNMWQLVSQEFANQIGRADYTSRITRFDHDLSDIGPQDSLTVGYLRDSLGILLEETRTYLDQLDQFSMEIRESEILSRAELPADSVLIYQRRMETVTNRVGGAKSDLIQHRNQIRSLLNNLGVQTLPNELDIQRQTILDSYREVFARQLDSLSDIIRKYEVLVQEDIEPILSDSPSRALGGHHLDSLMIFHDLLRSGLSQVRLSHRSAHLKYLESIQETGPVAELDNLHTGFEDAYNTAISQFNETENRVRIFQIRVSELSGRNDYTVLWIGAVALMILIMFLLIRENRNRRIALIEKESERSGSGPSTKLDFDEMSTPGEGYFPFSVHPDLESVVKEVHFSFKAIRAMNQMIHGSVRTNQANAFGGFLLGHQFKTTGQGVGMHVVMVDEVIQSVTLRPDFVPGVHANEDFVDEVDQVISRNRKKLLLGWFTASEQDDFSMQEPLIRLHRTFFRERWQIAMLVNPFSPGLETALFLRRKTGFFETTPQPHNMLNLDALYQFSLNPPVQKKAEDEFPFKPEDYSKLVLNSSWYDSVVQMAFIHQDVVRAIQKDLQDSRMALGNQVARAFLYGKSEQVQASKNGQEYILYVTRFVEARNGEAPRDLPGLTLLGWLHLTNSEIFDALKTVLPYHDQVFPKPNQVAVIIHTTTKELRVFSQKHNLEMNNSIIETEEFNLDHLLSK